MAVKSASLQDARLAEKDGHYATASVLYIRAGEVESVRRIAPEAAKQYGTISCIGFALDKFSKMEKGSEESAEYFAHLKQLADMEIKATKHVVQMLREDAFIASDKPGRYPHY